MEKAEESYKAEYKDGYEIITAMDKNAGPDVVIGTYKMLHAKNPDAEKLAVKAQMAGIAAGVDAYGILDIRGYDKNWLKIPDLVTVFPLQMFLGQHGTAITKVTGGRNIKVLLDGDVSGIILKNISFRPESTAFLNIILYMINSVQACGTGVVIDISMIEVGSSEREKLFISACTQMFDYKCSVEQHRLIAEAAQKMLSEWEDRYFNKSIQFIGLDHEFMTEIKYNKQKRMEMEQLVYDTLKAETGLTELKLYEFHGCSCVCSEYHHDIFNEYEQNLEAAKHVEFGYLSETIQTNGVYNEAIRALKSIYKRHSGRCILIGSFDIVLNGEAAAGFNAVLKDGMLYAGCMLIFDERRKNIIDNYFKGRKSEEFIRRISREEKNGIGYDWYIPVKGK